MTLFWGFKKVSQQFSTRIRDLQYWTANLETKSTEVGTEIDALIQTQAQLQRMHQACTGKFCLFSHNGLR